MARRASKTLSENCKQILRILHEMDVVSQKELIKQLGIPPRTVRYALDKLLNKQLIHKRPNLLDMRSIYYSLNRENEELHKILPTILEQPMVVTATT